VALVDDLEGHGLPAPHVLHQILVGEVAK